ncbi:MAG: hypothetical protein IPO26_20045 [Saprospiraceae bacterium]|nr:hypothetical protein [Saprospiraceae bacterium]
MKRFINEHPGSLFKSDAEALKKKLETSPPPDLPKEVVDIESKMANLGGGSFTLGCDKGSNCDG